MDSREVLDLALSLVGGNQAELARRVKRSETTVSRWVTGRNGVDFESALRLARMTQLPPHDVLRAFALDPELLPIPDESQMASADEVASYAQRFAAAIRGIPSIFWSTVTEASIRMAQAMPSDTTPVTGSMNGRVTAQDQPGNTDEGPPFGPLLKCKPGRLLAVGAL